ncbi:hypothetical protein BO71DRAFT_404592 [Aspergillus ellipticus CBS 707.79]|uniref:DUF7770 domain-containing protein n=1 Tax=Aspergillus ellipticus CBS 707.79 TaxID=1448320 RepID=A0A319CT58_9EURO|nr:hypothetical protein BO71DRAFT_404592 [Aspergillus ellipticus CBS 707.79]
MTTFQIIHFIPRDRQAQILALPVHCILACPHSQEAGTNHWCFYLSTSPTTSVQLDCVPSYTAPRTMLPGGSKANLVISELNTETSPDIQARFGLDVKSGVSVGRIIEEITTNGRYKYEFDENGVGCRFWVTEQIDLLYQAGIVCNWAQVEEARAGVVKLWPDWTMLPLDQGAYYE